MTHHKNPPSRPTPFKKGDILGAKRLNAIEELIHQLANGQGVPGAPLRIKLIQANKVVGPGPTAETDSTPDGSGEEDDADGSDPLATFLDATGTVKNYQPGNDYVDALDSAESIDNLADLYQLPHDKDEVFPVFGHNGQYVALFARTVRHAVTVQDENGDYPGNGGTGSFPIKFIRMEYLQPGPGFDSTPPNSGSLLDPTADSDDPNLTPDAYVLNLAGMWMEGSGDSGDSGDSSNRAPHGYGNLQTHAQPQIPLGTIIPVYNVTGKNGRGQWFTWWCPAYFSIELKDDLAPGGSAECYFMEADGSDADTSRDTITVYDEPEECRRALGRDTKLSGGTSSGGDNHGARGKAVFNLDAGQYQFDSLQCLAKLIRCDGPSTAVAASSAGNPITFTGTNVVALDDGQLPTDSERNVTITNWSQQIPANSTQADMNGITAVADGSGGYYVIDAPCPS
jgi:hypothetical protein